MTFTTLESGSQVNNYLDYLWAERGKQFLVYKRIFLPQYPALGVLVVPNVVAPGQESIFGSNLLFLTNGFRLSISLY